MRSSGRARRRADQGNVLRAPVVDDREREQDDAEHEDKGRRDGDDRPMSLGRALELRGTTARMPSDGEDGREDQGIGAQRHGLLRIAG